ncbi:hypothetical protein GCM10010430_33490 [Kitasatospora cystarginea]|uniref:Uncharacterized protein n=1 Tax=Kitasatospora cystarginea TaxID=58350 RepID=A0ABP5R3T8_9ACTN
MPVVELVVHPLLDGRLGRRGVERGGLGLPVDPVRTRARGPRYARRLRGLGSLRLADGLSRLRHLLLRELLPWLPELPGLPHLPRLPGLPLRHELLRYRLLLDLLGHLLRHLLLRVAELVVLPAALHELALLLCLLHHLLLDVELLAAERLAALLLRLRDLLPVLVLLPALLLRETLLDELGLVELLALLLLGHLLPGPGLLVLLRHLLLLLAAVSRVAWVPRLRALGLVAPAQISHRTPYANRQDRADRAHWPAARELVPVTPRTGVLAQRPGEDVTVPQQTVHPGRGGVSEQRRSARNLSRPGWR